MSITFVVNKLTDAMRSDFRAAFQRAKDLAGLDEPVEVAENPYYGDGVTVGLGVKGYDYLTLSPKQVVTRGLGVSFLQQTMQQAMIGKRGSVPLTEGVNYHIYQGEELDFRGKTVAIDIETAGNIDKDPWASGRILSIALYDGKNAIVIPEELAETEETARLVENILLDPSIRVVTWNGTFDIPYLCKRLNLSPLLHEEDDAMLMHYALYNTAGEHGLKPVARRFLGAPDWDADNAKYTKGGAHFENIPRPQLYYYNAADVYYTYQLFMLFYETLEQNPRARSIYLQRMVYSRMLQEIQSNGIPVDLDKMADLRVSFMEAKEKALARCQEITGNPKFNPGSPKQVLAAAEALGVSLPSTGADVLEQAVKKHPEIAELVTAILDYRGASKVIGSYIDNVVRLVGDDGKVHPGYKPHGAVTGRLSATTPAIQTIPRGKGGVRSAFRAVDEGTVIVQTDFSQAELRTVAELSGDENLIAAFMPGAPDFFDNLMTKIYPEEFPTIEDYESFATSKPAEAENKRALIKGTVYGCVPFDTGILTQRGVVEVNELEEGDLTWSHKGRWTPIKDIVVYESAPLDRYHGLTYDFLVTPKHRWPRVSRYRDVEGNKKVTIDPIDTFTDHHMLMMCPTPEQTYQPHPGKDGRVLLALLLRGEVSSKEVLALPGEVQAWLVEQIDRPTVSIRAKAREAVQALGFVQGTQFIWKDYEAGSRVHRRKARTTRRAVLTKERLDFPEPVFCLVTEDGTWTMEQNEQLMVTGNSNYGRSVPAIASALNIPVGEAQDVMDSYYRAYPGLARWQREIREAVGKPELRWRLTTPYGMQFIREVVSGYNRNSAENEALASVPQSTANEITLRAAVEIHNRLDRFPGAHIVALVHDNIAVLCREEDAEKIGEMMEREMQAAAYTAGFFRVPFVAEAEIGDSLDH